MKQDDFVNLMGEIEDDLLEPVNELRQDSKNRKKHWIGAISLAACLAVVMASVGLFAKPWAKQEKEALMEGQIVLPQEADQAENVAARRQNAETGCISF